jgi:hypothetical protein
MRMCACDQVSTVDASGAGLPAGIVDVRGVQDYLPPHPLVSVGTCFPDVMLPQLVLSCALCVFDLLLNCGLPTPHAHARADMA